MPSWFEVTHADEADKPELAMGHVARVISTEGSESYTFSFCSFSKEWFLTITKVVSWHPLPAHPDVFKLL